MRSGIYVDRRWDGAHGIGRFSREVVSRLSIAHSTLPQHGSPSSPIDPFRLDWWLHAARARGALYFSPGYNPPATSYARSLLTLHDLMHLKVAGEVSATKVLYYRGLVRPAVRSLGRFLTVSRYSADLICEWAGLPPEAGVVVGNGISESFRAEGESASLGYSYILYVGNFFPHKNVPALMRAFSISSAGRELRLVLTRDEDLSIRNVAKSLGIEDRLVFYGSVSDHELAKLYRGAAVVAIPSLMEGFGMPALEAMACGTPVVAANSSSLPEVCGGAALLADPLQPESIAAALDRVVEDSIVAKQLIQSGYRNAARFSWVYVADRVNQVLSELSDSA